MAKLLGITVCFALLSIFASQASATKRMVCYFGSWSVYRLNGGKFDVENIDPTLCTHLNYGFVGLSAEPGIFIIDPWNDVYDDYGKGAFTRFVNLRNKNPSLKTLVAIGGWNEGSIKYSQALATPAARATFTANAIAFIKKYGFDGLDLDWEYPGQRGGAETDKYLYTELLKTMRTEFDKHGYLLTAAVAAAELSFTKSYEIEALSTYLDFINVMTYDFHGAWETVTGHNAPLYGSPSEVGTELQGFNIDDSIKAWINYGADPSKLVLGVGLYGRTFTLASSACAVPRCPMSAAGWAGPITGEKGIMGYNEICKFEANSTVTFDTEAQVPYLVNGNQWVSYDNLESVQIKVNYIHNNNLGGAMVWSVDTDDSAGNCGHGKFPLLTLLSKGVKGVATAPDPIPVPMPEVVVPEGGTGSGSGGSSGGSSGSSPKRMVCYFGSWSVYRLNGGKFDVENIDPTLCTHLNYGFVGLSSEPGIFIIDPWNDLYDDYGKGAYTRFVNLKTRNPSAKTLVAIGGWNEGSTKYSELLATPAARATFTANAIAFIQKYGFDGLDLDWEYPGQRGGAETDKYLYTELLKTLRTEFDKYGYLLTAAVAAAESSFTKSYEIEALSTYLDFINVMTYDYHGAWETVTGHNAPLYGSPTEVGTELQGFNVDDSIKAWISYGADPSKLVLGVGLYGRTFTLASTDCAVPRCPMSAAGWAGPTTGEKGILGYSEICKMEPTSSLFFDDEAKVPYLVSGDQWVSYDNLRSVQLKVNYVLENNLGGAMVWSVDTDDASGACGNGKFPLLTLLSYGVRSGVVTNPDPTSTSTTTTAAPTTASPTTTAAPTTASTTTTAAPTTASTTTTAAPTTASTTTTAAPTTASTTTTAAPTTASTTTTAAPTTASTTTTAAPTTASTTTTAAPTTASTTTAAPTSTSPCTGVGYIRDPTNCKVFYLCSLNKDVYSYSKFTCSGTLVFDTTNNVCNYPQNVIC